MSNPEELSISELRRRRQQGAESAGTSPAASRPSVAPSRAIDLGDSAPTTPDTPAFVHTVGKAGRFASALRRRWVWLALAGLGGGLAGLGAGWATSRYSASLTLVQRDTAAVTDRGAQEDAFKPRQFSPATMMQLMASPELARRVAALAIPAVSEAELCASVSVRAAVDQELVTLRLSGPRPRELVNLLNFYAKQAVELTREIQLEDSSRLTAFLGDKLRETDAELERVRAEMENLQISERTADPEAQTKALIGQLGEVMTRLESGRMESELLELRSADAQRGDQARENVVLERLKQAREKLSEKLTRLTEAHPEVVALNAEIAELERQLISGGTNSLPGGVASLANLQMIEARARKAALANEVRKQAELRDSLQKRIAGLSQQGLQFQMIRAKQESLFRSRQFLADRQRAARLYLDNAAGYYRVLAEATAGDVSSRARYLAAALGLCAGLLLGLVGSAAVVCLVEARDDRIKTADDIRRVTGLPVLASLGDLGRLTDDQKDRWAFRTWTIINGKLNRTPDRGLVCGFISARDGEGKSTWIDLLVAAARRRGLRVLKITARAPVADAMNASGKEPSAKPSAASSPAGSESKPGSVETQDDDDSTVASALVRPADVALQLADPKAGAVDVCLPDWVWNLDHRRQWQTALDRWKSVENVVILVELPPAGLPESMLLAENVPQLIWLVGSNEASERETRLYLETLKHARCQIVGAVLNKDPGSLLNV